MNNWDGIGNDWYVRDATREDIINALEAIGVTPEEYVFRDKTVNKGFHLTPQAAFIFWYEDEKLVASRL